MSERICKDCGESNGAQSPTCRVCGARLVDNQTERKPSRLSQVARIRSTSLGSTNDVDTEIEIASVAARRSLDFALYGLVGFGLLFGLAAVLKGYTARSTLAARNVDGGAITKANWAIALGIFDMVLAPGLGFLLIGGVIYLWIA
jgi:hypothetical protein